MSDSDLIAIFFEFYESFPGYHALTVLFSWYHDNQHLAESPRGSLWQRFGFYLGADATLADPIAYVLWVDFFEDQQSVGDAWRRIIPHCTSEQAISRLLEISGPVPYDLKEPLYIRLMPNQQFHHSILKSLFYSAFDVYGKLEVDRARTVLMKLDIDRESIEFKELQQKLTSHA